MINPCYLVHPGKQRGAALLILLLLVVGAFSAIAIAALSKANIELQRQTKTLAALAKAKQALVSWSVLQGDIGSGTNPRPGTLPCPDTANTGTQGASCSLGGNTTIGRLPWKTLGTEELLDAHGERLWYAISNSFRRAGGLNNAAINSDTKGNLALYANDGITLLTPAGEELAALIFSPGAPLAGQDRNAGPNNAANYLDSGNGRSNASTGGPFIAGPAKDAAGNTIVNDLVVGISTKDLIAALEKRALKEAQNALSQFASNNAGKYPNPARFNGTNCASSIANVGSLTICNSDPTVCFGRLPEDVLWPTYVAAWFRQNGWGRVMTYAVNKNDALNGSGADCSTALNVDGQAKRYVIIAPGSARSGVPRPSTTLTDYLEDPANADSWTTSPSQPNFIKPGANSNDQLRSTP